MHPPSLSQADAPFVFQAAPPPAEPTAEANAAPPARAAPIPSAEGSGSATPRAVPREVTEPEVTGQGTPVFVFRATSARKRSARKKRSYRKRYAAAAASSAPLRSAPARLTSQPSPLLSSLASSPSSFASYHPLCGPISCRAQPP